MAKHTVTLSMPSVELGKVDATINIHSNNGKIGTITISKGGLDYYPNGRSKKCITVSWTRLDEIFKMEEKGEI